MLDLLQTTRINTDANEDDLKPGEYRDALNISSIANEVGAWSKGTTYGNIDTNIIFEGLNPDAICLGSAIDTAGTRIIVTFYQKIPVPFTDEYTAIINYAISKGYQVPSPEVQAAQNYLIKLMKDDGIWVGLDVFFAFFGDGDVNFALLNWKNPNEATKAVNFGMTYQARYGFKGNGTSTYMNTKFVPSTSVKFTLNNAGFAIAYEEIYLNTSVREGVNDNAGLNRVHITPLYSDQNIRVAVNSSSNTPSANSPEFTNAAGLIFSSRIDAATQAVRKNSGTSVLVAIPSSAMPTQPFFLGAINDLGGGGAVNFGFDRYAMFSAGESLVTFDRETNFYDNWTTYKNSFTTALLVDVYIQEVLMYLLPDQIADTVTPIVKSSLLEVTERSYLDGYSFVNELFFFNFRDSAPKVINVERALESPGFYDKLSETSLTVIKPHPPFAPVPVRTVGTQANAPIQKKPFQFMMIYHFVDGEQSTKSPVSEYLNSLDDKDTLLSLYDAITVTMTFPAKDYSIMKDMELFVRNNNAIADWRSVKLISRTLFSQAGENYQHAYLFKDDVIGSFFPLELSTKINDSVPQRSNYLAFIENRLFLIDSLIDYDFTSTFQILITRDTNATSYDDRVVTPSPLYGLAEFEYDSEYTVGLAFYDKYGRKYPSSINDVRFVTPPYVPTPLTATPDKLPDASVASNAALKKAKITAKYDLRAAGNPANYGKPPSFAYWWGMIRGKNTKWEFQQAIMCLLRFPYSITKWPDPDPAKFPYAAQGYLFMEDGYLYWDPAKLLAVTGAGNLTYTLVNDYIDVVIPPNFPHELDNTILMDFMYEICTSALATRIQMVNREVVEVFANKIRIRGDRAARWFRTDAANGGQYFLFPKFTTGVNLDAGQFLYRDETFFPVIIKRRRQNNLENILLYDTPQIYPVKNPGTIFAAFQPGQSASVTRVVVPPVSTAPAIAPSLNQGDMLIQPILLSPSTVAYNHKIQVAWGANVGDDLRLKVKAVIWRLNDLNQPILELYSATSDAGGAFYVKNNETVEYTIAPLAEFTNGWYGYGIQILTPSSSNVQFENPLFDNPGTVIGVIPGWSQSQEGISALQWRSGSGGGDKGGTYAVTDMSALQAGWSRTIYQYLQNVTKADVTVEVVIEGVAIKGPSSTTASLQYPGNTGVSPVNNNSQVVLELGRNISPFYIDCSSPLRTLTLDTLQATIVSPAPIGSKMKAEIWRVSQTDQSPISVITGSEGTLTSVAGSGVVNLPFGATKLIDTSGWYGISIFFDGPTFADFTDKSYANGVGSWIVTGSGTLWSFQPDTTIAPSYADQTVTPANGGTDLGAFPMTTGQTMGTPLFLPTSPDGSGYYDNLRLGLQWGDNSNNGWNGVQVGIGLWDVNQTTKKPLTYNPVIDNIGTIGNNTISIEFLSSSKLADNKWYMLGVGPVRTHPDPTARQLLNPLVEYNGGGWVISSLTVPGSGVTWALPTASNQAGASVTLTSGGSFQTNMLTQNVGPNGYLQLVLPIINIPVAFSTLSIHLYVGGVLKQTIDLSGIISSATSNTARPKSVIFSPFLTTGKQIGLVLSGVAPNPTGISIPSFLNAFNPYLYSTPVLRMYNIGAAAHESWRNFGTGVLDAKWLEATSFWTENTHGQSTLNPSVGGSNFMTVSPAAFAAGVTTPEIIVLGRGQPLSGNQPITAISYGMINMVDLVSPINFTHYFQGSYSSGTGTNYHYEVWVFNDPNTFDTTGVRVVNTALPATGSSNLPFNTSGTVSIPGGYKYIGHRLKGDAAGISSIFCTITRSEFVAQTAYNTWEKRAAQMYIQGIFRYVTDPGGFTSANFHADNIAAGGNSRSFGQANLSGTRVQVNLELFAGDVSNNYDVALTDGSGVELGRTVVLAQALFANPVITIDAVNVPTTTGLYIRVYNKNGTVAISIRARQMTNVNVPVTLAADALGASNSKTWQRNSSNSNTKLVTTLFGKVTTTQTIPAAASDCTVVLADASGVETSAQQTFTPNAGQKTLLFAPTLQPDGNYNFGVKVKNNIANSAQAGTIRIHSIQNVATNNGIAHLTANTVIQPLYEAWGKFGLNPFVKAGYVAGFAAVVNDLAMSAFTPVQINPTSYHVVSNVVQIGISGHSTNYAAGVVDSYYYGIVFPSASSDPDAAGIVYEQKTGQSIGDINVRILDLGEKSHSNIVRWSDPIIIGTSTNNLNAFLDSNKYAVDFQRGAIQVMLAMHDHTLFCVHTQGMSSLYVQRATMVSPAEVDANNDQLYLTNRVVGNDNKLTSNLGTVNPESCRTVESGTIAYGFDLIRKSFWQKTNNGVRNLTYECNAKTFFDNVCEYRLQAYNEGENVKIYSGYNEKQKSFYLTFAPFIFRGRPYPGITIAYNAYIDGFLSRYSFEPMTYLATEDIIHTVKAREMNNPDFFGRFDYWDSFPNSGTVDWGKSLDYPGNAVADTTVPPGTRILNPDFAQGNTFWNSYNAGATWTFASGGASAPILGGGGFAKDLVNSAGAIGSYSLRIKCTLPTTGLQATVKVYNPAGAPIATLFGPTNLTGDDIFAVGQAVAGRIGVLFKNTNVGAVTINVELFTTATRTYMLYQPMPLAIEDVRLRVVVPAREGSARIRVYSFNDPTLTPDNLLQEVNLIDDKAAYTLNINVANPSITKYIGIQMVTDYDVTRLEYLNVNSVPSIWKHDQIGRTNNFYGVQYDSAIELIFNVQAGQVRIFNSLGVMSETAWSVETITTSQSQLSALDTANFRLRDGIYSAAIMRDMLTPQESLPDPVNNVPIVHGSKMAGLWIKMILRNDETFRRIELRAVYLGSDELAGNLLGKK